MELTREQAIVEHRKMWRWIAEETEKQQDINIDKYDYLKSHYPSEIFLHYYCFCCEYIKNNNLSCNECPIDWGKGYRSCGDEGTAYDKWYNAKNYFEATKYAREIAELPERKVK